MKTSVKLKTAEFAVRAVQQQYNADHDTDPGTAPVHHTTYAISAVIRTLIEIIESQQKQIDSLLAAVPQADRKEGEP